MRGCFSSVLCCALLGCFSEASSSDSAAPGDTGTSEVTSVASTGDTTGASVLDSSEGTTATSADSSEGSTSEGSSSGGDTTAAVDTGGSSEDTSTGSDAPVGIDTLAAGDLVINEVMWNPGCGGDACEWLEILNATESSVNLLDLYVQDSDHNVANQGRITDDVIVGPGELVVITRGAGNWPYEFDAAAVYGPNPGLNNSRPDSVVLVNALGTIDESPSFPFDADEGIAWSLSPDTQDAVSNDSALNWCLSSTVLPTDVTTEFGTPGVPNEAC